MSSRRPGPVFLFSLFFILFGLWLALGRSKKTVALDLQNLREAVSSILGGGLFAKIQVALADGRDLWFYLSDPALLAFAGIGLLAAFVTGLAIWRITVMSWEAVRMKRADLRRPQKEQKPGSQT